MPRRGPDMLGNVAQPYRGRALGLEDGLVAEQDRNGYCDEDGEQPVLRSRFAMSLEGPSDRVGFR